MAGNKGGLLPQEEYDKEIKKYEGFKSLGLKLNMARGKPSPGQLDIADDILTIVKPGDFTASDSTDIRNYGNLEGLPELKKIYAEILDVPQESILLGGASSLNLMFDTISAAYFKGMAGSKRPWIKEQKVKFLCPCPGYDRHFAVSEYFGMELVPVAFREDGPDMDEVERIASSDPSVKGMWIVPIYSNPDGIVCSLETLKRMASMKTAAPDFTVMYDNAYCVHNLYDDRPAPIYPILEIAEKCGNPSRFVEFFSTSKITYAGGGISGLAANPEEKQKLLESEKIRTICYDKVNQYRHAKYLKSAENVRRIMSRQAEFLRPRFEKVEEIFSNELSDVEGVRWTKPLGGYFISFYSVPGTAKRVYELCRDAGVTLTKVGATYPYGKDPEDSNLRIAPSYPSLEDLSQSAELFCCAVRLAVLEKELGKI
ncbi:MAG: aminotransferase class I/II-fold pyridoxal phosphate-dependent enzyme [Oscillospiraceae bacterium]